MEQKGLELRERVVWGKKFQVMRLGWAQPVTSAVQGEQVGLRQWKTTESTSAEDDVGRFKFGETTLEWLWSMDFNRKGTRDPREYRSLPFTPQTGCLRHTHPEGTAVVLSVNDGDRNRVCLRPLIPVEFDFIYHTLNLGYWVSTCDRSFIIQNARGRSFEGCHFSCSWWS